MGKLVHGKFMNAFSNTSGFDEYGKFLAGDKLNSERLFITKDKVFQIGSDDAKGFKGHGGQKHILYWADGTKTETSDLWFLQHRDDEKINGIKEENVYTPYDDMFFHVTMKLGLDSSTWRDQLHIVLLPRFMSDELTFKYGTREEALAVFLGAANLQCGLWRNCYREVAKELEASSKPFVVVHKHGVSEELDFGILKAIYDGDTDPYVLAEVLHTVRWQHSITPFNLLLIEIKEWYFQSICLGTYRREFPQKLMYFRGKLGGLYE